MMSYGCKHMWIHWNHQYSSLSFKCIFWEFAVDAVFGLWTSSYTVLYVNITVYYVTFSPGSLGQASYCNPIFWSLYHLQLLNVYHLQTHLMLYIHCGGCCQSESTKDHTSSSITEVYWTIQLLHSRTDNLPFPKWTISYNSMAKEQVISGYRH